VGRAIGGAHRHTASRLGPDTRCMESASDCAGRLAAVGRGVILSTRETFVVLKQLGTARSVEMERPDGR
jgi:hypothetical protein